MGIFFSGGTQSSPTQVGITKPTKQPKKFEPLRAAFFLGFVIIIIVAGLWAGKNGLQDWSTGLLHAAEGFSGIALGLFIGEAKG